MLRWAGGAQRPVCVLMSLKSNNLLYEHIFLLWGFRRVSEGFVARSRSELGAGVRGMGANGINYINRQDSEG